MRTFLLLGVFAVAALGLFTAMSPPPAHQFALGQVPKADGVYLGSRAKPLKNATGVPNALALPADGGAAAPLCQFGHVALVNGDAGIVFRQAFTSLPTCTFGRVGATVPGSPVNISTAPSTTTVGIGAQSGGTDVVHFMCCGDL